MTSGFTPTTEVASAYANYITKYKQEFEQSGSIGAVDGLSAAENDIKTTKPRQNRLPPEAMNIIKGTEAIDTFFMFYNGTNRV
jgi:hypothetical protein